MLQIDVVAFAAAVAVWRAAYAHSIYIEPAPDDVMGIAVDRAVEARRLALAPLSTLLEPLAEILVHEAGVALSSEERWGLIYKMSRLGE